MIVCIFVESSECFKERVKDWFKERKVQVRFVESDANVDKLTELLFEHARDDTRLLLVLGGVDVKSKAVSSIALKRISDGRIYTLETYLCEYIAENCPECLLTSPTVGLRNQTIMVSLPDHEVIFKLLGMILSTLERGG
jgi:molybdopterin biosynthesis enzyme MoaB